MTAAIVYPGPVINDAPEALSDLGCSIERLGALFHSNCADLNDLIVTALPSGGMQSQAYRVWMIFNLAIEKLEEAGRTVEAIEEKLRADARKTRGIAA